MARISGVDIPRNKRVEISLTYIYGIGRTTSTEILARTNINPNVRVKDLTEDEVIRLREIIDQDYTVEGDLRRAVQLNIKRLMDIGCYRGIRHRKGLPLRGQRTKTNARTRRGKKAQQSVARRKLPRSNFLNFYFQRYFGGLEWRNKQKREQLAALNAVVAVSVKMCRVAKLTCKQPLTTRSLRSPTQLVTWFAGAALAQVASKAHAKALPMQPK